MLIAHSFYGLTVPPNSSVSLTATCKDLPHIFPPPENQNQSKVLALSTSYLSFPGGSMVKIICLQCRRPRCNPWVEKIPWGKEWLPTSRQEYWSGLWRPSPGDLPDPGIEPASLVSPASAGEFFTTSTTWEVSLKGWPMNYERKHHLVQRQQHVELRF